MTETDEIEHREGYDRRVSHVVVGRTLASDSDPALIAAMARAVLASLVQKMFA